MASFADRQRRTAELLARMGMNALSDSEDEDYPKEAGAELADEWGARADNKSNRIHRVDATGRGGGEGEVGEGAGADVDQSESASTSDSSSANRDGTASFQHPSPDQIASRASVRLSRQGEPIADRLYNDHARRQQRFRELEARLAAKAARNAPTFEPQINKSSHDPIISSGGEGGDLSKRLSNWKRKRSERLAAGKKLREEEEISMLKATPTINLHSSKIAERSIAAGRRDPNVSEHLYSYAPQMEDKLLRMRAQQMANEQPASPLITKMAANLERPGSIGDRLYQAGKDQQEKLNKMRKESKDTENRKAKRQAERKFTSETKAAQRSGRVGHSLYERAVENMKKKDDMRQKRLIDISGKQSQKHITPRSVKLAAKSREESMERLSKLTPRALRERELWKRKQSMREAHKVGARELPHQHRGVGNSDLEFFRPSDEADEEQTHAPAVNPLSAVVAEVRNQRRFPGGKGKDFGERLYSDSKTWRKKSYEQLKKEKEDKEMAECTFAPNTTQSKRTFATTMGYDIEESTSIGAQEHYGSISEPNSDAVAGSDGAKVSKSRSRYSSGVSTPDRLIRWQENKNRRIRKMQEAKLNTDIKACTFQPNLHKSERIYRKGQNSPRKTGRNQGVPQHTLRRSIEGNSTRAERSEKAHYLFYERQRRAIQHSEKRKTSFSPQTSFHTHPDLSSSAPSVDVMTNNPDFVVREGGGSQLLSDPVFAEDGDNHKGPSVEHVEKHLRRMARARSNRALHTHSQLENQLRNRWSVSGSTNPDLIAINAESSSVPKRHKKHSPKVKGGSKSPKINSQILLRKPTMTGDFQDHLIAYERARQAIKEGRDGQGRKKTSPRNVPLPSR